jgi:hypothetical protein
MTNVQIGILFFMGIITCAIIGAAGFVILNRTQNLNTFFSNPQNEIIGKWEVISERSTGTIYEFFPDGTLSTDGMASKYSFPDQAHIKIDNGNLSVVLEYTLSNNELILTNKSPIISINDNTPYILKLRKIK